MSPWLPWLAACTPSDPYTPVTSATGPTDTAKPVDSTAPTLLITDAPDPACDTLGCLRSLASYGTYTRDEIAPYLYDVSLDNGYEIVGIEYLTESGPATATVTLPADLSGPAPEEGFPIVANAHGTIGIDDPCALTGTLSGTGLAALFGGRGAIGVAPDYPGLGTPGFARYLDARTDATSTLDAVRAAIHTARFRGIETSERAALVGMSQGGHAVLAAAAFHSRYAPELDIRAFGAAAPANVYEEQWRAGVAVPGEHMVLHALVAWSFAEASGADRETIWSASLAPTVQTHLTGRCYWSPDFGTEPLMGDGFPTAAEEVFSADFLAEYSSGDWETFAFMSERFEANRITSWLDEGEQTAPIAIWQGTDDTTVLPYMTQALVSDLRAGGIDIELHPVAGGTHTTTAFGFLAWPELATEDSVAWVQQQLK